MISGIYAIVCKDTTIPEVYVGSTCNLENRIRQHKSDCCNNKKRSHYNLKVYQFIRDNGGFHNFKFIVLEHYKGEEEDLRQLERVWYETFPKELLLNSQYPFRSHGEYDKERYEKNKEVIKEQKKEYSKKYREKNKDYVKDYYNKNKEEINRKASEKIPCPKCLKSIRKGNISTHLKVCPNNHDV